MVILICNTISQYYYFYCIFDYAALVFLGFYHCAPITPAPTWLSWENVSSYNQDTECESKMTGSVTNPWK